jgi:hypothetical protein
MVLWIKLGRELGGADGSGEIRGESSGVEAEVIAWGGRQF